MNTKHAQYTEDRLQTLRRMHRRWQCFGWLLGTLAAMGGAVLLVAILDYWLLLPPALRIGGLLLVAGMAAVGVVEMVRLATRHRSLKDMALDLERRRPELGCSVSTAAEWLDESKTQLPEYAPELVAALQEQTARRLMVVETPWYRRWILRTAGVSGGVFILLMVFALTAPSGITALERSLLPWTQKAYTRIQVEPGDIEVPIGQDQAIQGHFSGRLPERALLEWRETMEEDWQSEALTTKGDGAFDHTLKNVRKELQYRIAGAQAVSPAYFIHTFVPPGIQSLQVRIDYPEYTGLTQTELNSGNLSVVRGSRLTFELRTSGDVTNARMRFATLPGFDFNSDRSSEWTARLKPASDLYYWLDLVDAKNRKGGNETPFRISLMPDEPPQVDLLEPGADIMAKPNDRVPLKISASDDFGIESVDLVFRKMNGRTHTVPVQLQKSGEKDYTLDASIDLSPLQLKEYELIAYHVEARDNNSLDGPGIGKSPVYFIEYTTKEKVLGDCRGGDGQRFNLIVLEKQILAATQSLSETNSASKFRDLAGSQRKTREYAEVFKNGFQLSVAPPEARQEFDSAMAAMNRAAEALSAMDRDTALEHEEAALKHLYEACRLLPELEQGMCRGGGKCIGIVLEAIEKLKQGEKKQREARLSQILAEAKRLQRRQLELNDLYRNELKELPEDLAASASASPGGGAKTNGESGSSKPRQTSENTQGEGNGDPAMTARFGELTEHQRKLAEEAAELQELLAELSGRDPRVSHQYSEQVGLAAAQWNLAAQQDGRQSGRGHALAANLNFGAGGVSYLTDVIEALELIYQESAISTDLASEAYPKAYEAQINAYLKKLSYGE